MSSVSASTAPAADGDERFDFPAEEEKILRFWDEIDAFQTSLKLSKGRPAYNFIDGPPFATGLPHYGHILAGTIKDVVTRYASLRGFHVERKFGWDCHGLPVEYEIDKKFGIKCKADVLKMGIPAYNAECRAIVMRYASEWEATVRRMARWIDFKNDYKTMYPEYMESVWWVVKELFGKDLIYRGYRVMPFSTACNTPLSNFEVALNYKDVTDPSLTVMCPIVTEEGSSSVFAGYSFLVWTTTPWTLPSNLALAVNPDLEYVRFVERGESRRKLIALSARLSAYYRDVAGEIEIIGMCQGSELVGLAYEPPYTCYSERKTVYPRTHTVLGAAYVTAESGTGVVHQAPGFGEDDYATCLAAGVVTEADVPSPVDEAGVLQSPVPAPFSGCYVKDADSAIMRDLDSRGRVFLRTQITHSYPFCWRSDTPLLYKTVPCWFVRVRDHIPKLLEASSVSRWVPDFVQEKRFHNWISSANDWAISRNRYWGTPIPIWASEDFEEVVCVGSVAELEALTGATGITDLHRESVDHLTIPSRRPGGGVLKRVDEVLDCWFESGSVPYAQWHYPFENKEAFEASFPNDFIAEGLDQTRGWFYTLTVLGAHLFGKAPFKNLVCNGLVLASDGKKMSKRLKNYPEPGLIFEEHGADALRLYLINSPVVRAEPLRFREDGVRDVVRDVLLPWWNSYRFLSAQLAVQGVVAYDPSVAASSTNVMDRWILAALQTLITHVQTEMAAYRLYAVLPPCLRFLDALTNWFIRLNRRRLKGELAEQPAADAVTACQVLLHVVFVFSGLMAPFAPLLAENIYQRLRPWLDGHLSASGCKDARSIHFLPFPDAIDALRAPDIERAVDALQVVVEQVRTLRKQRDLPIKTPLKAVTLVCRDDQVFLDAVIGLQGYLLEEVNVRSLCVERDEARFGVTLRVAPNFKLLGQRLKRDLAAVQAALGSLKAEQLSELEATGAIEVLGHRLTAEELQVTRVVNEGALASFGTSIVALCDRHHLVLLDCTIDSELRAEGLAREFVNRVQRLRKRAGLKASDSVRVVAQANGTGEAHNELVAAFATQRVFIENALRQPSDALHLNGHDQVDGLIASDEAEIAGAIIALSLLKL